MTEHVHVHAPAAPSNGCGVAGFILSLLGLVSCGVLAPFGILLSLIGLRKEPRGLAIAGTIIGFVAICGWGIPLAFFGTAFFGTLIAAIGLATPEFETAFELAILESDIERRYQTDGSYPASLSQLGLSQDGVTDGWDNPYLYSVDPSGTSYTLSSSGPDGLPDTSDDITP